MNHDITVKSMMDEIKTGLNVVDRSEYTKTLRAIAAVASDVVKKTLGPYAHTTVIDDGNFSYPTKDGWTVLSRLKFPDPLHQSIFRMLRQVSSRIVDKVGDGTTTAMVTAQHFIDIFTKALEDDNSPLNTGRIRQADVIKYLETCRDYILDGLKKMAIPVTNGSDEDPYDGIYRVALISSNGNTELANIIRTIYAETNNPNILVDSEGFASGITYEIQNGYRMECRVLMKDRYRNTQDGYYDTNGRPHLFCIFDHNVTYTKHARLIDDLINNVAAIRTRNTCTQHSIVLMAPHFDDLISTQIASAVNDMLRANPNAIPNIMMIQIPDMSRSEQRNYLRDFAAIAGIPITNATKVKVYHELHHNENVKDETDVIADKAMQMDEYKFTTVQALVESCVGVVHNAIIGSTFVNILDVDKSNVRYVEALAEAQEQYDAAVKELETSPTSYMKNYMEASSRLNKLSCNIGVIHVGGASDLERQCTVDIVDDTFRACRSAYESGIVPGLNMAPIIACRWAFYWTLVSTAPSLLLSDRCDGYRIIDSGERQDINLSDNELYILNMLEDAYIETSMDILRNKYPDHGDDVECWSYTIDGKEMKVTSRRLIEYVSTDIACINNTSYDIIEEKLDNSPIPKVANSVQTDIEILNGIVGILSLVLTSDQYISVARFYDKTAAEKRQELANLRMAENTATGYLRAFDKFVASHPEILAMHDIVHWSDGDFKLVHDDVVPHTAAPDTRSEESLD